MHPLASGPPMTPKAHKQLACCRWLKLCRRGTLAQVFILQNKRWVYLGMPTSPLQRPSAQHWWVRVGKCVLLAKRSFGQGSEHWPAEQSCSGMQRVLIASPIWVKELSNLCL